MLVTVNPLGDAAGAESGFVTVTVYVPALKLGTDVVSSVELTNAVVAFTTPKATVAAALKPFPLIVTDVPETPEAGLTELTVGCPALADCA